MKRAALLSFVIFVMALAAYLLTVKRAPEGLPPAVSSAAPGAINPASSPAPTPPTAPNKNLPVPAPEVTAAFQSFLLQDSKQLESMSVDTAAADRRENEAAAKMGPAEVNYARELALAPLAPANQRILAVDLLGRAPTKLTGQALEDIITKGMNSRRAEPHTVEELSNVQSKAFALMAVDAIADKAVTNQEQRDVLTRLEAAASDSTIKKHIQQRIRTLPPL